ncbi:MAG: polysaccharide deacetylase family protein [Thermoleophilia bacterium]
MRVLLLAVTLALATASAAVPHPLADGGGARTAGELAVERLARGGVTVYCGSRSARLVALTFDDGPGPYTRAVTRELRRAGARGTFFLVGERLAWWRGALGAEGAAGAIGNHTWTHRSLATLDGPGLNAEVGRTRSAEIARTGRISSLFRPPYGVRTPSADAYLRRLGVLQVLWDVADSGSGIRPGSIVLLHETRPQTVPLLRKILRDLKRRHLRAVTVPELLAATRPRLTRDVRGPRTDC